MSHFSVDVESDGPCPSLKTDESEEIQIFIAAPVTKRLIAEIRDTDTTEVTAARQNILDIVTGFTSH